ncbi:MAG: short-chain dehydrogenase [Nitrospirae bacterium GWD2_57_9]|nr:MAG: short-chain dehydrogenase [Nitrospirae bacterium GWD2_57_9]
MRSEKQPEVVVVTGGTAGVGRAIVRKFAMAGARIGIIARDCERLESAKEEVETIGATAVAVSADVSNAQMVENAAAAIEDALGPIDIWINNAMVSLFSPFKQMTAEDFRRVTEVTYLGYVHGTMAALSRMIPRDHGTIVQVGSVLAHRSIPLQSAYCGAKHAIRGFTDSIRSELMHDKSNVHITMVQLPAMNTPQFDWVRSNLDRRARPVPPIYQPEVGADAVYWAAHRKRREVYVGASTVQAIVANKVAPHLLDKYLARTNYQDQQTREPEDPHRADNLYQTVPGDYEAHGRFDNRSRSGSTQLWIAKHKYKVGLGLLAAGVSGFVGSIAFKQLKSVRSVEFGVRS